MLSRISNHNGPGDWVDLGPGAPRGIGGKGIRHTRSGYPDEWEKHLEPAYPWRVGERGHHAFTASARGGPGAAEREVR